MTDFETKCYGMSEADIRTQYMESFTATRCGLEMVVMGILSDCQEVQAMNNAMHGVKAMNNAMNNPMVATMRSNERVRKQLNVAKFILSEMMDQKESV